MEPNPVQSRLNQLFHRKQWMGNPGYLCGNPENTHHLIERLLKMRMKYKDERQASNNSLPGNRNSAASM